MLSMYFEFAVTEISKLQINAQDKLPKQNKKTHHKYLVCCKSTKCTSKRN